MDCPICFQVDLDPHNIIWLECFHNLCKDCFKKLVKKVCPFCRSLIKINTPPNSNKSSPNIRPQIRPVKNIEEIITDIEDQYETYIARGKYELKLKFKL